jgi:predicted aspartyl protease
MMSFMRPAWLLLPLLFCLRGGQAQVSVHKSAVVEAEIEIPLELAKDTVLVQAFVNGHGPLWMMLDTGADPSVVDLTAAKSAGLKLAVKGETGSGGGMHSNPAFATVMPSVSLGNLTATGVAALGMDLSQLSLALGRPISGVLGYSLLKGRIVQIDYPQRKVRFLASARACAGRPTSGEAKCTVLPFRYKDDILASDVTVNGKQVKANIDTGSNGTFSLTPAAVVRLGLGNDVARARASNSVGFNGDLRNREATLRDVTVGTFSAKDRPVVFYGAGMGMDGEPWDIRIGNKFLKNYVVTLDFKRGRVTLAVP